MTDPDLAVVSPTTASPAKRVAAGVLRGPRLVARWVVVLGAALVWLIAVPVVDGVRSLLRRERSKQ
jgi:hypothetical protein